MLFNSLDFLLFFPLVVMIYLIVPPKARYLWLLAASYYFYMGWNPKYALLIAFSTLITFLSGILMEREEKRQPDQGREGIVRRKKLIVAASFVINIGILVSFKYMDFLLGSVNRILAALHIQLLSKPFDVLLPVGISFYTFQALSYTMDVYRGEVKAEKNIFKYALFVSFFPQLVAGPIERSKNLLIQVSRVPSGKLWNYDRMVRGLVLMLWGFFLKMVIADRISILVDHIFNGYYLYRSVALAAGAIGFAVQIYCDFASYSTIAIGAAQVMGFELMENFDTPYFSRSIQEFWRRWHISLSEWFRDYLYIPLGGSRCSRIKRYRNVMITFLVSGLWHGASWSFVIWGGLHGFYQIAAMWMKPFKEFINRKWSVRTESISYKLGQVFITFLLTDFAWIFFRAGSIRTALDYIYRMVSKFDFWSLFDGSIYTWGLDQAEIHVLGAALVVLLLVDLVKYFLHQRIDLFLKEQCIWFQYLVVFGLLIAVVIYGVYGIDVASIQFLYFQF